MRGLRQSFQGVLSLAGLTAPLEEPHQTIVALRFYRVLVTIAVGAALSLSGGLLQGVFRNSLASPSILGVSAGASVGASVAILLVGGYASTLVMERTSGFAPLLVTGCGLAGALITAFLVMVLASRGGRTSLTSLVLVGIAVNTFLAGLIAAIQSLTLPRIEVSRAIFAWTFGTLEDRSGEHALLAWGALLVSTAVIPFVARELDLFVGGEEDAAALGVRTQRVKLLSVVAASLAAAGAVSVAGQISFVGLVVPHLLRLAVGPSHRRLLPLCLLGGPVFLLGADYLQRTFLQEYTLQPGILMSLLGGPFFLFLLVRYRHQVRGF